ncbi:MAG TPA: ATP-binding cassette domain-containing protein [Nakamurella sp.]
MSYIIEADGLKKRFGTTQALDGVDFGVTEGTVLGVLGPNGAGKTTAVRVLATLLQADSGRATIDGYDVVKDAAAVRRTIGLTGQYASVDEDLTGTQNLVLIGQLLNLSTRDARARAAELLDWFGLADAAQRRAKTFSGGVRRRLDLAASLVGPAAGDLPRRADHRAGPGQAGRHVGGGPAARHGRLDRVADHAVPRRGRRTRR